MITTRLARTALVVPLLASGCASRTDVRHLPAQGALGPYSASVEAHGLLFVSGKIGAREHDEFASAMDMIDVMPPGLYEAVIEDLGDDMKNAELIGGSHLFSLVPRTLDDIRKLGGNSPKDDVKFAAVDRVSTINRRLYESYLSPLVRSITPPAFGPWARKMHPNRLRFGVFSDENPAMRFVERAATQAREAREPVSEGNPFAAAEKAMASTISSTLSAAGKARDSMVEQVFHATYGSPLLQALVGLDPAGDGADRTAARDRLREHARSARRRELERRFDEGSPLEAALRAIIFIRQAEGVVDERGFAVLKQLHDAQPKSGRRSMAELKEALRDQSLVLRLDRKRAIDALPKLLPNEAEERARLFGLVKRITSAAGELSEEGRKRLAKVEKLFAKGPAKPKRGRSK